jgi:hypothetical protein
MYLAIYVTAKCERTKRDCRTNDHELRYLRRGFELAPHVGHSPRPLSVTNNDSFLSNVKQRVVANCNEVFSDSVQLVDVDLYELDESRRYGVIQSVEKILLTFDGSVEVVDDGLNGHG